MSIVIDDSAPILVPVGTPVDVPAPTRKGYHTFKRNLNETPEAMQIRVLQKLNEVSARHSTDVFYGCCAWRGHVSISALLTHCPLLYAVTRS